MGLFDKFDNIYNTDVSASQVCNMKIGRKPYEEYDVNGKLVGYSWHYGDTVELDFEIYGKVTTDDGYITAEEYLKGKNVKITIYNFRYEAILEKEISEVETVYREIVIDSERTVLDASTHVRLIIDEETSKKLLRGTYYITLTVVKENEAIFVPLLKDKDCLILIK